MNENVKGDSDKPMNEAKRRFTESEKEDILRRSRSGETQKSIAERYGTQQPAISRILKQAKKDKPDVVDPHPTRSTEQLQKRYWATYKKLRDLIDARQHFLNTDLLKLTASIERWDTFAQRSSNEYSEVYKQRADSYRLELALRDDKDAFNRDLLALVTELKRLSDILISVRGVGVGNPQI